MTAEHWLVLLMVAYWPAAYLWIGWQMTRRPEQPLDPQAKSPQS